MMYKLTNIYLCLIISVMSHDPNTTARSPVNECEEPITTLESVKYGGTYLAISESGLLTTTINNFGAMGLMQDQQKNGFFPNPWFNINYNGEPLVSKKLCGACSEMDATCLGDFPLLNEPSRREDSSEPLWEIELNTNTGEDLPMGWEVYLELPNLGYLCLGYQDNMGSYMTSSLIPKFVKNETIEEQEHFKQHKRNCLFHIRTY